MSSSNKERITAVLDAPDKALLRIAEEIESMYMDKMAETTGGKTDMDRARSLHILSQQIKLAVMSSTYEKILPLAAEASS